MKKGLILFFLFTAVVNGYGQATDTFQVYFAKNEAQVTPITAKVIDSLISTKLIVPIRKVTLLGYADNTGLKAHNDSLSYKRAESVRNYLIKAGFYEKDIAVCEGKGMIDRSTPAPGDGYAEDRKVQIVTVQALKVDTLYAIKAAKDTLAAGMPQLNLGLMNIDKDFGHIDIKELKVNETIELKDIIFEPGSNDIQEKSLPELDKLYKFMEDNPSVTIQVEGHICCLSPKEGTDERDERGMRSANRAREICRYLAKKGIAKDRMKFKGLGNTQPAVWPERREIDRIRNRRAVVRILSK